MKTLFTFSILLISSMFSVFSQVQKKTKISKIDEVKSPTGENAISEHSTGVRYSLILPGSIFPQPPASAAASTTNQCINGGDPTPPNILFSQTVSASDGAVGDKFGENISINANHAIVSATATNGGKGKVYFFEKNACTWTETQNFSESETDYSAFGSFLKIHDNIALAGSKDQYYSSIKIRLFEKISGVWIAQDSARFDDPTLTGASYKTGYQFIDLDISDSLAILSGVTNATATGKTTILFQKGVSGWSHSFSLHDQNIHSIQTAKILNNQAIAYIGQNRISTLTYDGSVWTSHLNNTIDTGGLSLINKLGIHGNNLIKLLPVDNNNSQADMIHFLLSTTSSITTYDSIPGLNFQGSYSEYPTADKFIVYDNTIDHFTFYEKSSSNWIPYSFQSFTSTENMGTISVDSDDFVFRITENSATSQGQIRFGFW
ncbi:hypothetical protein [Arcticibacterium luteifluviistationis]|uniref:Uncharacterized protein n=1 Tax=Arcticibacterium luteifluviistationis TaxID=1784714 RepID=A0A2Z4GGU5_9BACT|nr:hypothetical protein [Arcticibacterium luteifluviistationis]AWW00613.1 hypothetical protein DJ013_21455 [Arcticibacterium luteifluviistationis]